MKIISTRHGQTEYNARDMILGVTDIELNEKGLKQAEGIAEELFSRGIKIDLIVSSPMKRAYKTAQITSEKTGAALITDERLREWDYGEYEGKHRSAEGFAENKRNFAVKMGESGESLLQLAHRVYSVLDEIKEKHSDKTVLIVSHGGICRVIETYFNNMTTLEYSNWFMGNCEILEYNIETGEDL